jgi:oligopeptide transport system substrate-binding protein
MIKRRVFVAASLILPLYSSTAWAQRSRSEIKVLRRIVASELTSLDPQRPTGQVTSEMAAELFAGLTVTNTAGKVVPGCASKWTTSADGLTWTFTLRKNLSWSDGRVITARDFVFTLQRYLAPDTGAPQAVRMDSIVNGRDVRFGRKPPEALGVSAPRADTLIIKLAHPDVELPLNLVSAYCIPQHVVEKHGREWSKPDIIVSNGPYKMAAWAPGGKDIKLRRNPNYFDVDQVAIEEVEWMTGYDDGTRLRLFKLGEVDVASIEDMGNLASAKRELSARLRSSPECALGAIGINLERKPLDDVRVRRALSLALDRKIIANRVRGLGEQPWEAVLPPGIDGYPKLKQPEHANWSMPQRVQAARELLQAALGTRTRLKLGIGFPSSAVGRKLYLGVGAMWKAVGVDLELLQIDGRAYSAAIQRGDYDLYSYASFAIVPSASVFLDRFVSDSSVNVARYKNPAYDKIFNSAERQLTVAERFAAYGQAESLLLRDVPLIPLWAGVSNRLVSARVQGWIDHPSHSHPSQYLRLA